MPVSMAMITRSSALCLDLVDIDGATIGGRDELISDSDSDFDENKDEEGDDEVEEESRLQARCTNRLSRLSHIWQNKPTNPILYVYGGIVEGCISLNGFCEDF
ncbi:hypothetical protein SARC_02216 [Sphaeroforma arctica JP610]|uniref:Uncharacterized protein n=1 Tax=Sphaeroforma arctica JP610 TaxID=667725 RepID=A0A0L0G9D6_9EUKA|nr:hypothetical protein SARC_02216 [Sphaeroforma arctica JP610]KNC85595.1 hypothetical protein SARC_02216 [Sphaeroforma arctica JP610]|eukprot:XP_014159497.1 hypothetical protein SARC_02216 [Sphaeroforma arctica JP610]